MDTKRVFATNISDYHSGDTLGKLNQNKDAVRINLNDARHITLEIRWEN